MEHVTNEINNTPPTQQQALLQVPNYEDYLIFYKIMHYPVPQDQEYFLFEHKLNNGLLYGKEGGGFSRHKKNPHMEKYITFINKFGRLYKSLPFIQSIYLCNSISFNAIKDDSDIDLFIITKKNKLRRARFFSVVFFFFLGLKRSLHKKNKKFCLSFYVSADAQNLYNVTLPKTDIYFSYRLAHLVPLYQEKEENIYKHNQRLQSLLPNFPNKHMIYIGSHKFQGSAKIKKIIEYVFGGSIGSMIEKLIKFTRLPLVLHKTKKHGEAGRGIILSPQILKFHLDIRKKVRVNYNLWKRGIHKTIYGIQEDN